MLKNTLSVVFRYSFESILRHPKLSYPKLFQILFLVYSPVLSFDIIRIFSPFSFKTYALTSRLHALSYFKKKYICIFYMP